MATLSDQSKTEPPAATIHAATGPITLPRITIQFCTQCKWNLRAAYYAQELLQTFSTSLGEVALLPSTSGIFIVKLYHRGGKGEGQRENEEEEFSASDQAQGPSGKIESSVKVQETTIWDRKADGGFPETKELKNRVRNVIEPGRGLGHTDRALKKAQGHRDGLADGNDKGGDASQDVDAQAKEDCQDCP